MESTDIYVYAGDIHRNGYLELTNVIKERKEKLQLKKNVLFCVATYGGDPNAGYRIGRALQHHYEHVTLLVVGPCKSAGTLIAIAANKLIIGDMGELGPLDTQLKKSDEIGEMSSGLAIMTSLDALKDHSISAFTSYLVKIRYENQINTKMSADIAARLTEAFIAPMAAQIDPIKIGEHQRAMNIAIQYGNRLNDKSKCLKDGAIYKLIASYPSHGFVIDRKEARELFNEVESPSGMSEGLYNLLYEKIHDGKIPVSGKPEIIDLSPKAHDENLKEEEEDENAEQSTSGDGDPQQSTPETNTRKPKLSKRNQQNNGGNEETTGSLPL
ncbi:SppA protein [Xenorhabdus nematophila]|uniref:SDH family Clp fold serine proteinase n=1 Tax=Xenorhabdus nematophila TaxID=628 RepID=UPI0032B70966